MNTSGAGGSAFTVGAVFGTAGGPVRRAAGSGRPRWVESRPAHVNTNAYEGGS